jgi:hypothetical protein
MTNVGRFITMLLCLSVVACAAPPGVPQEAKYSRDWMDDQFWTWRDTVPHGCVIWDAVVVGGGTPGVSIALSADIEKCATDGPHHSFEATAPGVTYSTSADDLTFRNYWPWSEAESASGIRYDNRGMMIDTGACPHSLSTEQLGALRVVAQEAMAHTTTEQERRTLTRVDQLLAITDGAVLKSGQTGCYAERGALPRQDPWSAPRS